MPNDVILALKKRERPIHPPLPPSSKFQKPLSHPQPFTAAATTTAFCFSLSPPPRRQTSPSSPSPPPHSPSPNVADTASSLAAGKTLFLSF
ncbi:uncharacterized protein DS421_9g258110 [Arachis hypogaea]|nr:uncharacterized protein DS421_9g258110 [Arachis hypogaea]